MKWILIRFEPWDDWLKIYKSCHDLGFNKTLKQNILSKTFPTVSTQKTRSDWFFIGFESRSSKFAPQICINSMSDYTVVTTE